MRWSKRLPDDLTPSELSLRLSARRDLVDLTVSNPTAVGLHYEGEVIRAGLSDPGVLAYEPEALGSVAARRAVADYARRLGRQVSVDRLALTASTSEAYAAVFKLLCDPGDSVAVAVPSYPLVPHLAELEALAAVAYPLRYDDGWRIDLAGVERALADGARAVVVVSPNNPTGSVPGAEEARLLRELCARYEAAIVVDEVFGPYGVDGPLPSLGSDDGPLTFVLDGLSKGAALPQLKLGWIASYGPRRLVADAMARLEWLLDAYLSVSAPVQVGAAALLGTAAAMQAQVRARLRENRTALAAGLSGAPARLLPSQGGWYAVLRLERETDEEALVDALAAEAGVLVQPGFFYDFVEGSHLVVSLLQEPGCFARGVGLLAAALPRLARL